MAGRTVRAWALRLLLVVGAAGAVTAMHSLPIAAHDSPQASSVAHAMHVAVMAADSPGGLPLAPAGEHHRLEHLCLAVLTAVAISIALAFVRCLWRRTPRSVAAQLSRWGDRSRPSLRPPSLARLCVLRL